MKNLFDILNRCIIIYSYDAYKHLFVTWNGDKTLKVYEENLDDFARLQTFIIPDSKSSTFETARIIAGVLCRDIAMDYELARFEESMN